MTKFASRYLPKDIKESSKSYKYHFFYRNHVTRFTQFTPVYIREEKRSRHLFQVNYKNGENGFFFCLEF